MSENRSNKHPTVKRPTPIPLWDECRLYAEHSPEMQDAIRYARQMKEHCEVGMVYPEQGPRMEVGIFYDSGWVGICDNGDVAWYDIGTHRMELFRDLPFSDCIELAQRIGVLPSL
jgi:hypothetical protein